MKAASALATDGRYASTLVTHGESRSLFRTPAGNLFWLEEGRYIDDCIIRQGVFEPACTHIVERLVRPGQIVFDVGANIGYYSVLLSRIVGPTGRVYAFEPTTYYRSVLLKNLAANNVDNVDVLSFGLSDCTQDLSIHIGPSSATLHSPKADPHEIEERISLISLDEFVERAALTRIDFMKVDIDGHEPLLLNGATKTRSRFNPLILLEVSHLHYLQAGVTAWDFYESLKRDGYYIYDEEGLRELGDKTDFLIKCGNFAYSRNILISPRSL